MIDFRQATEEEKREYKRKSNELRRERYAIKKGRVITIKQKVHRAIKKIHDMRVTRFERLISERAFTSGLTRDELTYLIRKKHYEQAPIIKEVTEKRFKNIRETRESFLSIGAA
jgi:hypothetical protein